MKRLSAAGLLLFVSSVAHAQESAAPQATGPIVVEGTTTGEKEDKVICRRERETGSIRSRKVCRTASQIAQEQSRGERTLDTARTQRQGQNLSQNHSGG